MMFDQQECTITKAIYYTSHGLHCPIFTKSWKNGDTLNLLGFLSLDVCVFIMSLGKRQSDRNGS